MRTQGIGEVRWPLVFRDGIFWGGVSLAVVGSILESAVDGRQAFETFLLFGGLFIGMSAERSRHHDPTGDS